VALPASNCPRSRALSISKRKTKSSSSPPASWLVLRIGLRQSSRPAPPVGNLRDAEGIVRTALMCIPVARRIHLRRRLKLVYFSAGACFGAAATIFFLGNLATSTAFTNPLTRIRYRRHVHGRGQLAAGRGLHGRPPLPGTSHGPWPSPFSPTARGAIQRTRDFIGLPPSPRTRSVEDTLVALIREQRVPKRPCPQLFQETENVFSPAPF